MLTGLSEAVFVRSLLSAGGLFASICAVYAIAVNSDDSASPSQFPLQLLGCGLPVVWLLAALLNNSRARQMEYNPNGPGWLKLLHAACLPGSPCIHDKSIESWQFSNNTWLVPILVEVSACNTFYFLSGMQHSRSAAGLRVLCYAMPVPICVTVPVGLHPSVQLAALAPGGLPVLLHSPERSAGGGGFDGEGTGVPDPWAPAVGLREPRRIAQAAATLEGLPGGRAEVVLSSGNFGLLSQYGIDWAKTKPLSRVIEGVHVIRTLLDDGAISRTPERGATYPPRRPGRARRSGPGA